MIIPYIGNIIQPFEERGMTGGQHILRNSSEAQELLHILIAAQQDNMVIGSELIGRAWHGIHIPVSADSQDVQSIPLAYPEIDHGMADPGFGDLRFIDGVIGRQAGIIIDMVVAVPYGSPVRHLFSG